jgi:hypothetical protein
MKRKFIQQLPYLTIPRSEAFSDCADLPMQIIEICYFFRQIEQFLRQVFEKVPLFQKPASEP